MQPFPAHWTLRDMVANEFGSTWRNIRENRRNYALGCIAFVILAAIVAFIRTDASILDTPAIFVASIINFLRIIAIVSLLFAWILSKFVQIKTHNLLANKWIEQELVNRPNESFPIPFWRFIIPAVCARIGLLLGYVLILFWLLFFLPERNESIHHFLPRNGLL